MTAWEGQFDRVQRCLAKVEAAQGDTTAQLDDMLSFFQNCWHLKDWIKNDSGVLKRTRDAIVRDVEKTDRLLFCADLANGSKHLELTNVRRGAKLFRGKIATKDAKTGKILSEAEFTVVGSSKGTLPPHPSDIVGFAKAAVKDWETLLKKHGLR